MTKTLTSLSLTLPPPSLSLSLPPSLSLSPPLPPSLPLSLPLSFPPSLSLFLSPSPSPSLRLADGIPVDGDVEEGARDLLELNSYEINGAAITLTETATTGGVAQASGNGRKRSTSGMQ